MAKLLESIRRQSADPSILETPGCGDHHPRKERERTIAAKVRDAFVELTNRDQSSAALQLETRDEIGRELRQIGIARPLGRQGRTDGLEQ